MTSLSNFLTEELTYVTSLKNVHSYKNMSRQQLQPWTKLVENPVNSRNGRTFQIPNSPPYPTPL